MNFFRTEHLAPSFHSAYLEEAKLENNFKALALSADPAGEFLSREALVAMGRITNLYAGFAVHNPTPEALSMLEPHLRRFVQACRLRDPADRLAAVVLIVGRIWDVKIDLGRVCDRLTLIACENARRARHDTHRTRTGLSALSAVDWCAAEPTEAPAPRRRRQQPDGGAQDD